jgi:hypothetical protein
VERKGYRLVFPGRRDFEKLDWFFESRRGILVDRGGLRRNYSLLSSWKSYSNVFSIEFTCSLHVLQS